MRRYITCLPCYVAQVDSALKENGSPPSLNSTKVIQLPNEQDRGQATIAATPQLVKQAINAETPRGSAATKEIMESIELPDIEDDDAATITSSTSHVSQSPLVSNEPRSLMTPENHQVVTRSTMIRSWLTVIATFEALHMMVHGAHQRGVCLQLTCQLELDTGMVSHKHTTNANDD